jgi:LysR family nitrogen assimilation transcriptional regulator
MKLKLDVQVEADSFRVLISLVEEGLGYALLPPSSVRHEVVDGRLEIAAISNPAPIRELTIASPPPSTTRARQLSLITSLLRDEVGACRAEGLWDIDLT